MPKDSQAVIDYRKRMEAAAKYAEKRLFQRADRMVQLYQVNHYYRPTVGIATSSLDEYSKGESERVKVAYPYANSRQILAEILPYDPEPVVRVEQRTPPPQPDPAAFAQDLGQGVQQAQQEDPEDFDQEAADMMKGAIKYVTRKSNMKREYKMAILDAVVTGIGCTQLVAQTSTLIPKFRRLTYREFLCEWGQVTDPYRSDFVAVKEVSRLDLLKKDPRFRPDAAKEIRPCNLDPLQYGETSNDLEYGVIWHLFDKRENIYLCFADEQDFELQKGSPKLTDLYNLPSLDDDFPCDFPFAFEVNEEMLTEAWGMGDIYPIESQVRELDRIRSRMLVHTKRFNRKYLARRKSLDAAAMNQLKSPEDGTIIQLSGDGPLQEQIQPLLDAPLSGDTYKVEEAVLRDLQVIQPIGADSVARGVGQAPDTLGQSQIIEQNANTRLGEKQKTVVAFVGRLFWLTAYYIRQYWTMEQELLASGDGSKDADFVSFDPLKAQAELDYDVAPESLKDNTKVYRDQLNTALATLAPLMPVLPTQPGLALMARKFIETFETLAKDAEKIIPEEWINPTPPAPPMPPGAPMGQGAPDPAHPDEQLKQIIAGSDPQQFLDSLKNLPDHERNAIEERVHALQAGAGAPPAAAPVATSPIPAPNPTA